MELEVGDGESTLDDIVEVDDDVLRRVEIAVVVGIDIDLNAERYRIGLDVDGVPVVEIADDIGAREGGDRRVGHRRDRRRREGEAVQLDDVSAGNDDAAPATTAAATTATAAGAVKVIDLVHRGEARAPIGRGRASGGIDEVIGYPAAREEIRAGAAGDGVAVGA